MRLYGWKWGGMHMNLEEWIDRYGDEILRLCLAYLGMTGSGSSTCFGDQIIQTETLGREELHDSYTLRAFNCWDQERYETCTFTMCEE